MKNLKLRIILSIILMVIYFIVIGLCNTDNVGFEGNLSVLS